MSSTSTGFYQNLVVVAELPPKPKRTYVKRKPHYKVVQATARALSVASASPNWVKLARYATHQDARRATHKLRTSRVWAGIGTLKTAYREDGDKWVVYAQYTELKLSEQDIEMNLARNPEDAAEALYGDALDGDSINVVTGVSMQVLDPSSGLEFEDQTN